LGNLLNRLAPCDRKPQSKSIKPLLDVVLTALSLTRGFELGEDQRVQGRMERYESAELVTPAR
jgi:hypothetical protein